MDLANLTSMSVRDIAEELTQLEVKELEIPKFAIPNWPSGVVVSGCLGKRDYRVPVLQGNNLFTWRMGRHKISFWITDKGVIGFRFHFFFKQPRPQFRPYTSNDDYYSVKSDHHYNEERLATMVLFDQFKIDVLLKVLPELKNNSQIHNQVIEEVKKAFEPFIPFVVMDQLTS